MQTPMNVLQSVFGYTDFRPGQKEIIDSIVSGHDSLALLPTGGGKSLCFQIPGICLGGTTIVVSPLLSLMQDQVEHLQARNVSACTINSSLPSNEKKLRLRELCNNKYQFVYVAPETLLSTTFIDAIQEIQVRLIVVDEAHCISEWGEDFRPEYLNIHSFVSKLTPRPVVAAFTATATPTTQKHICSSLHLISPLVFKQSFKRRNLNMAITVCPDRFTQDVLLGRILEKHTGQSGIIYTSTREQTEHLATYLTRFYDNVAAYHGGMEHTHRSQIQTGFQQNKVRIVVATNAFGMGVDKSNVRFVVHYHIPSSIEAYYQEIGRAGRDGLPASTYGLFFPRDLHINAGFLPSTDDPLYLPKATKLQKMIDFINCTNCRTHVLLSYFGESTASKCHGCDNCQPVSWARGLLEDNRYQRFLQIRDHLASQYHIRPQQLLTQHLLQLIALYNPANSNTLAQIPGIGRGWTEQWAEKWQSYFSSQI